MQQADLFLVFTAPLEAAKLDYMVSGSVARMIYGEPRLGVDEEWKAIAGVVGFTLASP